jgi:hypothetical protein
MPRPNRCAPDGTLHAVAARGLLMGNRGGRLHRDDGSLGRARWRSRAWICCLLAFRGRRRQVMGPGYTEIFFLDEATALAAGHRPCFECRRAAGSAFAAAFPRPPGAAPPRAPEIDRILHAERTAAPTLAPWESLPDGTIFAHAGSFVLKHGGLWRWSFAGYAPMPPLTAATRVRPLTPPSSRSALAAGYRPAIHPSAGG